jgi:cell division protease FtsH
MDRMPDDESQGPEEKRTGQRPTSLNWALLLAIGIGLAFVFFLSRNGNSPTVRNDLFWRELERGNVAEFVLRGDNGEGKLKSTPLPAPESTGETSAAKAGETAPSSNGAKSNGQSTNTKTTDTALASDAALSKGWDEVLKDKELKFHVNLAPSSQRINALEEQLIAQNVKYRVEQPMDPTSTFMIYALAIPLVIMAVMWLSVRRSQSQIFGGGGFLSGFTRSPAKRYEGAKQPITFKDVAGLEGVKADLLEIVEFLKNPKKFQKLGGRVPKGVLLMGPPGTGKTLLARAIAGEAGVPFFSVNGSEFIQMFVGVGASRVRDLFRNAKDASPSIIFIDEIDAVGRQRGAGLGGGHDEREQTLNQILGEMDGFSQTDFVIIVAATNRPDVLDPALLRPGRFDRHVTVDRPTQKGRAELFKVHTREVPLAPDVDLERLAAATIGLTGADIRNLVNEAALWAARLNKTAVEMDDFEYARDKVLMGAKREEVLSEKQKEKTAYHEAGHAILGWNLSGAHRVHKVTVVPRGRALGVTQFLPTEEIISASQTELRDRLAMMLGGRAAEKLVYNETNVGAENDLERATAITRRMVMSWGMSERLGPVSYKIGEDDPFLGREMNRMREYSEATMEIIDEEVARILHEASERALKFLAANRPLLDELARQLVEKEELDEREIETILGPPAHKTRHEREGIVIAPEAPMSTTAS